jgi:hypothetical protein
MFFIARCRVFSKARQQPQIPRGAGPAAYVLKGDVDDPMTEIIVNKIVDLVMAGASNDADRSAELVLLDLADDGPRPSASVHVDREMRSDLLIPMR